MFASGGLRLKSSSLHMILHGNICAYNFAKELFKPSKDLTSLRVCNEKKYLVLGFFVCNGISGDIFGPFHLAPGSNY